EQGDDGDDAQQQGQEAHRSFLDEGKREDGPPDEGAGRARRGLLYEPGGAGTGVYAFSRPHTCASSISTRAAQSISSRHVHSSGEWKFCSPADRFGVGSPSSVSRDPSVPPRTIVRRGSTPARRIASSANGIARGSLPSPSAMFRYCFVI